MKKRQYAELSGVAEEVNPIKKYKMSNDFANVDEQKNINEIQLMVHRLILKEFVGRIIFFTAVDLNNYLLTCKQFYGCSATAWNNWHKHVNERLQMIYGMTSKKVNLRNKSNNCFMSVVHQSFHHISLLFNNFQPMLKDLDRNNPYLSKVQEHLKDIMSALSNETIE